MNGRYLGVVTASTEVGLLNPVGAQQSVAAEDLDVVVVYVRVCDSCVVVTVGPGDLLRDLGQVAVEDELPGGGRELEAAEAGPPPEADGVPGVGEVGTAGSALVVEAGEGSRALREVLTTSRRGLEQVSDWGEDCEAYLGSHC